MTFALADAPIPFSGGWEAHRDRHCIWIVSPEGYVHHHAFDEVAEALSEAFTELGGSAPITRDPAQWGGRSPIVLGPNLLRWVGSPALPSDSILYNLEQFAVAHNWFCADYMSLLRRYAVLDYNPRNQLELHRAGITHAHLLEVGYSPTLTRIPVGLPKDIDVLFYGVLPERRLKILEDLHAQGLKVVALSGVFGTKRDEFIARAKIVLNIHQYGPNVFELVRVSFLLANRVCVVSEGDPSDSDFEWLSGGLEVVPYEELVSRCIDLAADENRRKQIAETGFARFTQRRQALALARCILNSGLALRRGGGGQITKTGLVFGEESVAADNTSFTNCDFHGTTFVYHGGEPPTFGGCRFTAVQFRFAGAAHNTFAFLQLLKSQALIDGI